MLDDFVFRTFIAALGVALVAGPLGCFVIWRRLSYFGDTLAHASLLGAALAYVMDINLMLAVFLFCMFLSVLLVVLQKRGEIPSDSLLGILSHSALALGLVVLSLVSFTGVDMMSFLTGDILSVTKEDIAIIYAGGGFVLLVLFVIWKQLFVSTVNEELAYAEGMKPQSVNLIFMLLLAIVIAISIKIVGALLITALLIIPAATARQFSSSPEQMAILASLCGIISVTGGLSASFSFDTPTGPSIVVAAFCLFLISLVSWLRPKQPRRGERP